MTWAQAFYESVLAICGTVVLLGFLISLMDFHFEFRDPREAVNPRAKERQDGKGKEGQAIAGSPAGSRTGGEGQQAESESTRSQG